MNVIKLLIPTAAIALLALTSCESNPAKPLSEVKNADRADSLIYYYAQMRAGEYWRSVETDTAKASLESRERYIQGVIDGMNALRDDDDDYNSGFKMGVRTATGLNTFANEYGMEFDKGVFISSLKYGLSDAHRANRRKAKKEYYAIKGKLETQLETEDLNRGRASLKEEAAEEGFSAMNEALYKKVEEQGTGRQAKEGDRVLVDVEFLKDSGSNLGLPSPECVIIGNDGRARVMALAYSSMKEGEHSEFMTTAADLFGSRTEILGLRSSDIIIIDIKMKDVVTDEEYNNPDNYNDKQWL